jgi:hypothetical protein
LILNLIKSINKDDHYLNTNYFKFASIEENCIKIWEFEDDQITTVRKINIKQKLVDAVSSDIVGFLIALGRNGKVLILDSNGDYVSSIERSDLEFTSLCCSQENLYLGTFNGSVLNYHLSSLQLIRQLSHVDLLRPFEMK